MIPLFLQTFIQAFGRAPTNKEHLAWIKLHVMPNNQDKLLLTEVKEWKKKGHKQ